MPLKQYSKKRDLKISKEPPAKIPKKSSRVSAEAKKKTRSSASRGSSTGKKLIFVVHDHHASHHHWDLRLEMNKVLKSWAIPKNPPLTKGIKRLAIQVEDHPLAYAKFEGTIPKGNYGAGQVKIWDKGTYELKSKNKNKIEIIFHGEKLKGDYVLVKTNYRSKPEKSWLFMKI